MGYHFHQTVTSQINKKKILHGLLHRGRLLHLQNVQPYLVLHFCKGLGRSEKMYNAVHYLVIEGVNLVAPKS